MADKLGGIGQSYGRFRPRKTVTIDDARLTYIRSTYGSFRRPGQQVWTELGSISAVPEIEKHGTEMAVAYLDVTTLHAIAGSGSLQHFARTLPDRLNTPDRR
jgi:hypothetical protein